MEKNLSYNQALIALTSLLPKNLLFKFPGTLGLQRILKLLELLGNPQEKLKIIHVAGTSGKTSTATILANLLRDQGFKVGLTISPHLLDIRERIQINNTNISKSDFASICTKVIEKIKLLKGTPYADISYFEALITMAFCHFYDSKVNYAVVETGLGGTFDGTNVINNPNKLNIITRIGLDHTQILGKTLPEISIQKAGIIHQDNTVLTLQQMPRIMDVFQKKCRKTGANLITIKENQNYTKIKPDRSFNFNFRELNLSNLKLHLLGDFQVENTSLALSALQLIGQRDHLTIKPELIRTTLNSINVPGRFSLIKFQNHDLILDGAHNPQKMKSFINSLIRLYPEEKFVFIIAFKKTKQYQQCLKLLLPIANHIIIAEFFKKNIDTVAQSVAAESLAKLFHKWDFTNFELTHNATQALDKALNNSDKSKIVVTGSLYLISDILPLLI